VLNYFVLILYNYVELFSTDATKVCQVPVVKFDSVKAPPCNVDRAQHMHQTETNADMEKCIGVDVAESVGSAVVGRGFQQRSVSFAVSLEESMAPHQKKTRVT